MTTKTATVIRFILNEKEIATSLPPGMVLLDFIRYHRHLMGTKIGCREGDCGACAVLVGELKQGKLQYQSMTSCLVPLGNAHGKHIVTIEGVNFAEGLNPLQQAMADEGATQCGFCTPGFVVSLAGFCLHAGDQCNEDAVAAVDGNICRCTGYKSIERAAAKVAALMEKRNGEEPAVFAAKHKILPEYFAGIRAKLVAMGNGQLTVHDTGSSRQLVAGGTDLYVQKQEELTHADIELVFDDPRLKDIRKEGGRCLVGASATVTDLQRSPVIREFFPEFDRYAKLVSSTPIRNMATIAGNFINASPIGDFTIFFLALDAQLVLTDGEKKRDLPLRKLYRGYKQLDKQTAEYIEQIWFKLPGENSKFHFEKVSKRTNLDIASVNTAIHLRMDGKKIKEAGLSAGGVAPVPLFLKDTSNFLTGNEVSEELIEDAIGIMETEISPISDARGSKAYKTFLLGQLVRAHFMELFPGLIQIKPAISI